MIRFALGSLWNRSFVAALTVLAIALSVALILGVERLRDGARDSFSDSVSGIDIIVAPRGNSVQILMATVFGVGGTGTGMEWDSFEWLHERPDVVWAVPIQMGDNHRGYPVIGTEAEYFEHFRHSGGQPLSLSAGAFFESDDPEGAVVGAEVATRFGYGPGTVIVNAHGSGEVSFDVHDDAPFTIRGVLAPTGTAVDRMVLVSLAGFDTIHANEESLMLDPLESAAVQEHDVHDHAEHDTHDHAEHDTHDHAEHDAHDHAEHEAHDHAAHDHAHAPEKINAVYVGLSDRLAVLGMQRAVNDYTDDALSAVIPAVALAELWNLTGTAEQVMKVMAWVVALAGLIGMMVMLSATLDARRREFAILRSVGATPRRIFGLILTEAAILTSAGLALGCGLLFLATLIVDPLLAARFGVRVGAGPFGAREMATLATLFCAGLLAALVPAIRVYRTTLADGLSVRV